MSKCSIPQNHVVSQDSFGFGTEPHDGRNGFFISRIRFKLDPDTSQILEGMLK